MVLGPGGGPRGTLGATHESVTTRHSIGWSQAARQRLQRKEIAVAGSDFELTSSWMFFRSLFLLDLLSLFLSFNINL